MRRKGGKKDEEKRDKGKEKECEGTRERENQFVTSEKNVISLIVDEDPIFGEEKGD